MKRTLFIGLLIVVAPFARADLRKQTLIDLQIQVGQIEKDLAALDRNTLTLKQKTSLTLTRTDLSRVMNGADSLVKSFRNSTLSSREKALVLLLEDVESLKKRGIYYQKIAASKQDKLQTTLTTLQSEIEGNRSSPAQGTGTKEISDALKDYKLASKAVRMDTPTDCRTMVLLPSPTPKPFLFSSIGKLLAECNSGDVTLFESEMKFNPDQFLEMHPGHFFVVHSTKDASKSIFSLRYKQEGEINREFYVLDTSVSPPNLSICQFSNCQNGGSIKTVEDFCRAAKAFLPQDARAPNPFAQKLTEESKSDRSLEEAPKTVRRTVRDEMRAEIKTFIRDQPLLEQVESEIATLPIEKAKKLTEHFKQRPKEIDEHSWHILGVDGLSVDQYVYRSASWKDLKEHKAYDSIDDTHIRIAANPNSVASIADHLVPQPSRAYEKLKKVGLSEENLRFLGKWDPSPKLASELESPSYNVGANESVSRYGGEDSVFVRVKLRELLKNGGRIYRDTSAVIMGAYIISVPKTDSRRIFERVN